MLEEFLNQELTYWVGEQSNYDGSWKIEKGPITIDCRWRDKQKQVKDKNGEIVVSESTIHCMAKIPNKSFLVKGKSLESTPPDNAKVMLNFEERLDIEGDNDGWVVYVSNGRQTSIRA